MSTIEQMLKGDWYKTASREEMAVALTRLEDDATRAALHKIQDFAVNLTRDESERLYIEREKLIKTGE